MIYSPVAIDYKAGLIKHSDGTLKPVKIGCWVLSMNDVYFIKKNYEITGELK